MKISIIGNAASGKTRLANDLAKILKINPLHIDSLQFDENLNIKDHDFVKRAIEEHITSEHWIVDGYGPLDTLMPRLNKSDLVVYMDPPIQKIYFWFFWRLIKTLHSPRPELPLGSSELKLSHIVKGLSFIKKNHTLMRPELLRLFSKPELKNKTKIICSYADTNSLIQSL